MYYLFINYFFLINGFNAGNFWFSKNFNIAPPPLDTYIFLYENNGFLQNILNIFILSPPPITILHFERTNASIILLDPLLNAGYSTSPIGPFQTIVFAPSIILVNNLIVSGQISKIYSFSETLPIAF